MAEIFHNSIFTKAPNTWVLRAGCSELRSAAPASPGRRTGHQNIACHYLIITIRRNMGRLSWPIFRCVDVSDRVTQPRHLISASTGPVWAAVVSLGFVDLDIAVGFQIHVRLNFKRRIPTTSQSKATGSDQPPPSRNSSRPTRMAGFAGEEGRLFQGIPPTIPGNRNCLVTALRCISSAN